MSNFGKRTAVKLRFEAIVFTGVSCMLDPAFYAPSAHAAQLFRRVCIDVRLGLSGTSRLSRERHLFVAIIRSCIIHGISRNVELEKRTCALSLRGRPAGKYMSHPCLVLRLELIASTLLSRCRESLVTRARFDEYLRSPRNFRIARASGCQQQQTRWRDGFPDVLHD